MILKRETISKAILKLRDEYIEKEMPEGSTYWDINNGDCDNFALDTIYYLSPGGETENLYCVVNGNFQIVDDIWDKNLLNEYWKDVKPLYNLTWEDTNKIRFGNHMWITDGKYHYDAECPEGVKNFFELPIFKRYFEQAYNK